MDEPFARRPEKANTLKAKTDKIVNVESADTPEAIEDAHGEKARKARKRDGCVEGSKAPMRLDRPGRARGGKVAKKGTTVNVIIAGQGQQQPPQHIPVPVPVPPPGAMPPPGALPPRPMGPPSGVPMGGPPGLSAAGPMMGRARGGAVNPAVKMRDGAGGGEGRLEKVKAYGSNAKQVERK